MSEEDSPISYGQVLPRELKQLGTDIYQAETSEITDCLDIRKEQKEHYEELLQDKSIRNQVIHDLAEFSEDLGYTDEKQTPIPNYGPTNSSYENKNLVETQVDNTNNSLALADGGNDEKVDYVEASKNSAARLRKWSKNHPRATKAVIGAGVAGIVLGGFALTDNDKTESFDDQDDSSAADNYSQLDLSSAIEDNQNYSSVLGEMNETQRSIVEQEFDDVYNVSELEDEVLNQTDDGNLTVDDDYLVDNSTQVEVERTTDGTLNATNVSNVDFDAVNDTLSQGSETLGDISEINRIFDREYEQEVAKELALRDQGFNESEVENISVSDAGPNYTVTLEHTDNGEISQNISQDRLADEKQDDYGRIIESFKTARSLDDGDTNYKDSWFEEFRQGNLDNIITAEEVGLNYEMNTNLSVNQSDIVKGTLDGEISELELDHLSNQNYSETDNLVTDPLSNDWNGDQITNDAALTMFDDPLERQELFSQNSNFEGMSLTENGDIQYQINTEDGIQTTNITLDSWDKYSNSYNKLNDEINSQITDDNTWDDELTRNQSLVNVNNAFMTSIGDLDQFEDDDNFEEKTLFDTITEITDRMTNDKREAPDNLKKAGLLSSITDRFNQENANNKLITGINHVTDENNNVDIDDVEQTVEDLDSDYSNLNVEQTVEDNQYDGGSSTSSGGGGGGDNGGGGSSDGSIGGGRGGR